MDSKKSEGGVQEQEQKEDTKKKSSKQKDRKEEKQEEVKEKKKDKKDKTDNKDQKDQKGKDEEATARTKEEKTAEAKKKAKKTEEEMTAGKEVARAEPPLPVVPEEAVLVEHPLHTPMPPDPSGEPTNPPKKAAQPLAAPPKETPAKAKATAPPGLPLSPPPKQAAHPPGPPEYARPSQAALPTPGQPGARRKRSLPRARAKPAHLPPHPPPSQAAPGCQSHRKACSGFDTLSDQPPPSNAPKPSIMPIQPDCSPAPATEASASSGINLQAEKEVQRLVGEEMKRLPVEQAKEEEAGDGSEEDTAPSGKGKSKGPRQNYARPAKRRYKERKEGERWATMMEKCKDCWVG